MKFVDEAIIEVKAGNGGNGCLSFFHSRFFIYGPADGGDGGDGGNVYIRSVFNLNTLSKFHLKNYYNATNGLNGSSNKCNGKSGVDLFIDVPSGTRIYVDDKLMIELLYNGQFILVAKGGMGGKGNAKFKSSVNRNSNFFTLGGSGESKKLFLKLILLADIGLLGLPNAGKSSFINAFTRANSRVADYHFTTLYPKLGSLLYKKSKVVIADIPGIIKGASTGSGLGLKFLGHLSKTKLLLHIVDISYMNKYNPITSINIVNDELKNYYTDLKNKPQWFIFNKIDLIDNNINIYKHCGDIINNIKYKNKFFLFSSKNLYNQDMLYMEILKYLF